MKLAVDSSALVKRYVQEYGSDTLGQLLGNASELAFCTILVPEILSACNRRVREQSMAKNDYQTIKHQLLNDVRDATVLQITPAVISGAVRLLEESALRAMDALHVSCARAWQADLFITADRRQYNSALRAGIRSQYLGQDH